LDVMRLRTGDEIQAFDGTGRIYSGRILSTAHKSVQLVIERIFEDQQTSEVKITLVQAVPKRDRMDYIVEKATELGIDTVIPVVSARTIVRLNKARRLSRKLRWQRLILEASKQCGQTSLPQLKGLTDWQDLLPLLDGFDLKLLFSLSARAQRLKDVLAAQKGARRIALLIGPEGDFTPAETEQALDAGCIAVSLGRRVLKSDTAAISALAMINYELG